MKYQAFNKFQEEESKTIDFSQVKAKSRKPVELIPASINQEKYILSLFNDNLDIVIASGPAGTGKTYLAVLAAIKALREGRCDRIVLTRPAISVENENHGFLPGDITEKMEPWVKPLIDVLKEYYSTKELVYMLEEQIIEITPLAFCRGRTFKNCWVIGDEMQNSTPNQLKMLLTRIGENSKIVLCGDIEQTDRKQADNGLMDLTNKLFYTPMPGMEVCTFENRDIRRHKIIEHVLKLYP